MQLQTIDALTGMSYQAQVQEARAALAAVEASYRHFVDNLRVRYNAPEKQYNLNDWAEGFTPVESEHAENN